MEKEIANKDNRDLKSKIRLSRENTPSFIVLIVSHKEKEFNGVTRLNAKRLIPIDGYPNECKGFGPKIVPIGGYVYDATTDSYLVNCIDYLPIGLIPYSFKARMEGVGLWSISVPIPESVVKRYLNQVQRADLDKFNQAYKSDQFEQQYIQFISAT